MPPVRRQEASARAGNLNVAQPDFTAVRYFQAGDQSKQGCLSASAGPVDDYRFLECNLQGYGVERRMRRDAFRDVPDGDGRRRHRASRTETANANRANGLRMTAVCRRARTATCEGGVFAMIV